VPPEEKEGSSTEEENEDSGVEEEKEGSSTEEEKEDSGAEEEKEESAAEEEVVNSVTLSPDEIAALSELDEPALLRFGLYEPNSDTLGDNEHNHVIAAFDRAYRALKEDADAQGIEGEESREDAQPYTTCTLDGGLTGKQIYIGSEGTACPVGPCRGECVSALDIGNLHTTAHAFQSSFEWSKDNITALLQVKPMP